METKASKDKEIRIPGPDHPITISPAEGRVRVTVAGRIVAESTRALRRRSKGKQELADQAIPLTANFAVVACRAGEGLVRELFEPLGYSVAPNTTRSMRSFRNGVRGPITQ
jgi:hypothetical protein